MRSSHAFALIAVATAAAATACGDATPTTPQVTAPDFTRYVAIGNSVSMGWEDDGVLGTTQQHAWPKYLASAAGVSFALPLIASPGCAPQLAGPLGTFSRLDGSSVATTPTTCAPNAAGVSLPTNDLAIEGATAASALAETPENPTAGRDRPAVVSRVLPAGSTQISAMRAMKPTFVSVDFGGNEVLPAQIGLVVPNVTVTPFATFQAAYAKIIDSVKATGAKALLMGLPRDIRQFPTIRSGAEIAAKRAVFAALNVSVNANCDGSPNFVFVRGKVLTAVATAAALGAAGAGPYDLSCADVPGTPDYILTPSDITAINALLGQMNDEISRQAQANGYALASLDALYSPSKTGVTFDPQSFLGTATPYGPTISLDGIHPTAAGQKILANAAIAAINSRYGAHIVPMQ